MRCCDELDRTVTVCAGSDELSLLRCRACEATHWERRGSRVTREQAFAHLALAYRDVPLQARAARDRAATASAARQAARLAAQARIAAQGLLSTGELACAASGPVPDDLSALLVGWTVLGATG